MRGEKCLKSSIFPNIPPFIVNLPTINQQEIGKNTENVPEPPELRTIDMMVELRESLWRIPLAFLEIVRIHELKTKDRPVFGANVAIPKTFTKDKTNHVKKSYSKPKSMITDEKVLMVRSEVPRVPKVPGFFRQNTKDQSSFSDDHGGVKVSPFPACTQISRKDNLWVHFKMMQDKYGTKEFNFLSDSYNLPGHRVEIERRMGLEPGSLWIIKPLGRNNGTGIRVINSLVDLPGYDEEVCVQRYIENPYLIHNKKFDLRIYVLLTSLDPLRIYIYDEGLVRFATEKYSLDTAVLSNSRVHVTNYAINKDSDKFVINTSPDLPTGNKWSLSSLWRYLSEHSSNTARLDTFQVWSDIQDIVIKSIFCGLDSIRTEICIGGKLELKSDYNTSKLFGYDILLDENLKPHLIEINTRPAALNDTLDALINRPMVEEMFQIIGYHVPPAALSNHARKSGSCQLLDFDLNKVNSLGFNPAVYTRTLDDDDIKKQNLYPRQVKERSSYIPGILDRFTGSDVRVLRKTLEEFYNLKKFSRIFPTRASSKYLNYLNTVSYYDKLLDGFVTRYGENGLDNREEDGTKENGLERIRTACDKNMHL